MLSLTGVLLAAASVRGHGDFVGTIALTPIGDGLVDIEIDTVGNITHLGRSTVRVLSTADFSGAVPAPVPPSEGLVTAANGDTIAFTLRWTAQSVASGVFEVTGPFEVTAGTGRFTGAGGGGHYRGHIDTNTGDVTAEIDGLLLR
jgi:hypothetical protein